MDNVQGSLFTLLSLKVYIFYLKSSLFSLENVSAKGDGLGTFVVIVFLTGTVPIKDLILATVPLNVFAALI